MAFASLNFPEASLTQSTSSIVAPIRHEWCHFMNVYMGKCAVKNRRMLMVEIHAAAAGSTGSPKREDTLMIHKSCRKKAPRLFHHH